MEVDEDVCVEFSVKDDELAEFNEYNFEDEPEHETCEISEEHITASLKSKDDKSYSSDIMEKDMTDLTNEQTVLKQTNNDQNKSGYKNSKCKERRNRKCKKSDESTGNGNFKRKNLGKRRATSTITAKPVLYNKNDNVFQANTIKEITDKVMKAKHHIEEQLNAVKSSVFVQPDVATNFSDSSLNVENVLYPPGEPEWNKDVDNTAPHTSEEHRKCQSTDVQWQPSASQSSYQCGNYTASVGNYSDPVKQQLPTFEYSNQSAGYYNCPPILQSYNQQAHYYNYNNQTEVRYYGPNLQDSSVSVYPFPGQLNYSCQEQYNNKEYSVTPTLTPNSSCSQPSQERFPNILPANPVYSIASGISSKVVTHPLLPSSQKPVILAVPVSGAEGLHKNKESSSTNTNLSSSTNVEESSNDSNIVTSKMYSKMKKFTGEVSVLVNNICLNVKMSTFKKVLQTLGRLLQYVVTMKKPEDISSSCKAMFSNIETASRAVRILSKLTICHQKLLVAYDGNTADCNYHSKSDVLRDKYLMNTIFKILTHDNPKLLLSWDDDSSGSHKKETLQKSTATSVSKCDSSTASSQQSSCGGRLGSTFIRSRPSNKKRSRFGPDNYIVNYGRKGENPSSCSNLLKENHSKSKFEENKNMLQKCISSNNTTKSSISSTTTKNTNENQLHPKKDINISDDEVDMHGFTAIKIEPKKIIHLNLNSCTEKNANVPTISNLDQLNIKIVGGMKNLSKITVNAINDVFMGSTEPMFDKGWLFSIPNEKHALLLHKCLNQCRVLDDILQVHFTNGKVPDVKYCEEDYMLFKHETEKALNLHNIIVEQLITTELKKDVDTFNFKLEPCTEIDCSNTSCHHYHSRKDKRRDPRQYFYRYVKCPEVWMNQPCPRGDMCELCHSEVEFLLHPTVFLTSVCPQGAQCSSATCGHVHPGSPNVFYHSSWKDLYVEGLHNTVLYIAGAIRNLHKLDDKISGVHVLAIVANPTIAVEASKLLKDIATRHGVKISTITTGREDPSGCELVIGNPSSLLALLFKKGTRFLKGLRAFIVEDISSLIEHKAQKVVLLKLTQLIMKVKENPDTLNKVLIAKDVFQKHVAFVEGVLSTHLSVVGNVKEADNAKLNTLENKNESIGKINISIIEDICRKEKISEDSKLIIANRHFPKNDDVQKYRVEGKLQTAKHSNVKMSVITAEESECVKSKFKRRRTDEVNNVEDIRANKALRLLGSPMEHVNDDLQNNVQHHAKKDDILTPQMFLAEEKFLRKEFEKEYRVYLEVPEIHPLHNDKFSQFLEKKKNKYGKSSSFCEEDWISCWQAEVEILKECEWKKRKMSLIEKYKTVLALRKPSMLTNTLDQFTLVKSVDQPSASHRDNKETSVSVPNTVGLPRPDDNAENDICVSYDVLEKLHGRLGLLGVALIQLIKMVREAGSTSRKALDILLQEDNVVLQKLCIDKLKKELKGAPPKLYDTLSTGLSHAEKLFKYAPEQIRKLEKLETGPKEEEFCGMNLRKIAVATEGKSPLFVANFIKCTLDFQGKTASKDDLDKLFLKISSIHLDMSLMKEKGSETCSTKPVKNIIQTTSSTKEQSNLESMTAVTVSVPAKRSPHGINDGKQESVKSAYQPLNDKANQSLIPEFNRSTDKKCDFEKSSYQCHLVPDQTKATSSFDSANISLASILNWNTSADTLKDILKNCSNEFRSDVLCQVSDKPSCDDQLTQADSNSSSKMSTASNNRNVTVSGKGAFDASVQQGTDVNTHRSVPSPVQLPNLTPVHSLRSDYAVDHTKTSGTLEKLSGAFDYSERPTTSSNSLNSVASAHFASSYSHNLPEKLGSSYGSRSNSYSSGTHLYDSPNSSNYSSQKRDCSSLSKPYDVESSFDVPHVSHVSNDKPKSSQLRTASTSVFSAFHDSYNYSTLDKFDSRKLNTAASNYPSNETAQPVVSYSSDYSDKNYNLCDAALFSQLHDSTRVSHASHYSEYSTPSVSQGHSKSSSVNNAVVQHYNNSHSSAKSSTDDFNKWESYRQSESQSGAAFNPQSGASHYSEKLQSYNYPDSESHLVSNTTTTTTQSCSREATRANEAVRLLKSPGVSESSVVDSKNKTCAPLHSSVMFSAAKEAPVSAGHSLPGSNTVDHSNSSTWFLDKVKSIVNNPDLTLSVFNKNLATILQDKPASYKFSKSDLTMVKELQTLGSLDLDEALFIATLKGKFLGLV